MRRPRCNDTTPSARRRNPRPAWSWDEAPRVGTCSALLLGVRPLGRVELGGTAGEHTQRRTYYVVASTVR